MASSIMFSAMSLDTVIGTKRQTYSPPDGLNLKKRRKQSKPVRIASTEDSQSWDEQQASASRNLIVSGNFSFNSDLKMIPLNLSKNSEYFQKNDLQVNISNNSNSDVSFRKQNIYPHSNSIEHENLALNLTSNGQIEPASQVKIFNLEAYCDLCNKEFCNKYFLRTHKANKHRIYESSVESAQSKALASTKDTSGHTNLLPQKSWSGKKKNNIIKNGVHCKSLAKNYSNGIHSTMRAFCNICRKEFCNKYFVRRHKVKIHGLLESTLVRCSSESSSIEDKNGSEIQSQSLECAQDSTNDSEVFEKEDNMTKNQWYQNDSLKISCSFCNTQLYDTDALLKHLEEIHNNPDGEINVSNSIVNMQLTQNNIPKESFYQEASNSKPNSCDHEENSNLSNMNSSIDDSNANNNVMCMKKEEARSHESENMSPLNLALGNNNVSESLESTWVLQNCIFCGEQIDSFFMYHTHMMKCHNIHISPKDNAEQKIKDFPSLSNPNPDKTISLQVDREKYADDVKTLHAMILKMNYTEKQSACDICLIDFKNIVYLEHHILVYHRALLDIVSSMIEDSSKDVYDSTRDGANTPQDNTQMSSFCDICKKELCNKYFMKTHMQRMHGISIETGTHIGGVICDICNKELCSKYFLRVHKQNSHGLLDDSIIPRMWVADELQINSSRKEKTTPSEEIEKTNQKNYNEVCSICNKRFRLAKCLKTHLSVEHGEKSSDSSLLQENPSPFSTAGRTDLSEPSTSLFQSESPSRELLASEIAGFASQNSSKSFQVLSNMLSGNPTPAHQYQCSECSFSTSALAYLYVHKRSHSQELNYSCPVCSLVLESRDAFNAHFSLHEKIESVEIQSQLGETCWTAASSSDFSPAAAFQSQYDTATTILPRVQETLMQAASKLHNPLSFAVPYTQGSFVMQPFFVESANTNESVPNMLSSFVFLPVKEKLFEPITATLKLTPTQ